MATSSVASASRLCLADLFTSYPNLSARAAAARGGGGPVRAVFCAGAISALAHAQSITFAGVQTTMPASGRHAPFGLPVDKACDPWN
jgi:hypothetical protein